jgi:ribosomal protein S17E
LVFLTTEERTKREKRLVGKMAFVRSGVLRNTISGAANRRSNYFDFARRNPTS